MLTFIINLDSTARLQVFRAAVGGAPNVTAVCVNPAAFLRSGEVDAQYLSLTYAERFGSRPIPPHTVAVLRTTAADQEEGLPRFILTGICLHDEDPNTPAFAIPLLAAAIRKLPEVQESHIQTIGIGEHFLCWGGASLTEVGALVASEFGRLGAEM